MYVWMFWSSRGDLELMMLYFVFWASRYERDNICIKPVSSNRDDEDEISHTDLADSTKHTQMKDHY